MIYLLKYACMCPVFSDVFKKCKTDKSAEGTRAQKVMKAM